MAVKIKMLKSLAGVDFTHRKGSLVTVEKKEAESWAAAGICEIIKGRKVETAKSKSFELAERADGAQDNSTTSKRTRKSNRSKNTSEG